ncbi:MAG: OmpH family outer membrane protein [Acetobacteraceae bacterium]|nr:OmpH family outer membrane protein [Acetobacteraceae bacterium]
MVLRFSRAALLAGTAFLSVPHAIAQGAGGEPSGGPGWFMPGQPRAAAPRPATRAQTARPVETAPEAADLTAPATPGEPPPSPVQVQLPPPPTIPDVPRGAMPPAAVIGVLSIPDALRASSAYTEADKTMGERRQKLNEDAQKEQVALRELGQQLGTDRAKMTPDQIRAKERELQDRISESRRKFSERGRIIQDASQYALAQIERTLGDVVQRVAAARGMNLVLQRAEVALNQSEFDITQQVAELLNKTLPSVQIPPDGVEPAAVAPTASAAPAAKPVAASAQKPAPTAASNHAQQHR